MITTLLLTFVLFAIAMLVMAIGLFFRRPCLRGSCGGPEVFGPDGEPLTCDTCPRRKEGEARLGSSLPVAGQAQIPR